MKRLGFWVLLLPLMLAGTAVADDGDRADGDGARERSRTDWRAAMRTRMEEAVKKFDKDGDGKLDEGERRAMFESFRERGERSRDSADRPAWPPRPQFGQFPRGPWQMGRRPEPSRSDKAEDKRDGDQGRGDGERGDRDRAREHDRRRDHHARGHHRGGGDGDHRRMARGDERGRHRGPHARGSGDRHREHRRPSADGDQHERRPESRRPRPERRPERDSERQRPRA